MVDADKIVDQLLIENNALRDTIDYLVKDSKKMRDALWYYADMGNYIKIGDVLTPIVRTIDGPVVDLGRTARAALGGNL
jgi:uncharacterized caspase-like protein